MNPRLHTWFSAAAYELCWRAGILYILPRLWPLLAQSVPAAILFAVLAIILALVEYTGLLLIFINGKSALRAGPAALSRLSAGLRAGNRLPLLYLTLLVPLLSLADFSFFQHGIQALLLHTPSKGMSALTLLAAIVALLLAWLPLYRFPVIAQWLGGPGSWKEACRRRRPLNPFAALAIGLFFLLLQVGAGACTWLVTACLYTIGLPSRTLIWLLRHMARLCFSALAPVCMAALVAAGTMPRPAHSDRSHPERFLAFLAAAAVCLSFLIPADEPADRAAAVRPITIAHRGYARDTTENTMASFKAAWQAGADMIELDVYQNPEGILYISHDQNLQRVTGQDVDIQQASAAQIEAVRTKEGEPVATLEEALQYARETGIQLQIEVKSTSDAQDTARKAAALVDQYNLSTQCAIAAFRHSVLNAATQTDPDIRTVMLLDFAISDLQVLNDVDIYSVNAGCVTPDMIAQAHAGGKRIYVWTIDDRAQIDTFLAMGADGIVTDNAPESVAAIRAYVAENGLRQTPEEKA